MRNLLIGLLVAGSAVTPLLAQDNEDQRWHHDRGGRGEGPPRQQQQVTQQQLPLPQVQRQEPRRPGGDDGNLYRQQQARQFVREQQQVQAQEERPGGWERGRFGGHGNDAPQRDQEPAFRNGGAMQVESNRSGIWTRTGRYRGDASPQHEVSDGWYGQRAVVLQQQQQQQQYRQGSRYANGGWDRNWRGDSRYDWRRYREGHRLTFHLGVYVDPFGYGYQPFSVGYRLPPIYFGQRYWINPALYDLPYPPPGTAWVRYWNDALLIDIYSGEVVDSIHGFFW